MTTPPGAVPYVVPAPRTKPPSLFRISRGLHRASSVAFILLIIFLVTIVYSAASLGANGGSSGKPHESFGVNEITFTTSLNLTNRGIYPVTGLTLTTISYIAGGAVVGGSSVPGITLAVGAPVSLPIVEEVSVAPGAPGQQLLVSNANVQVFAWLNATFGYLFVLSVGVSPSNQQSWNAPFEGFHGTVTESGTRATVTISFTDEASIDVVGSMVVVLSNTVGTTCGSADIAVNAPAQGTTPYSATGTATLIAGCVPAFASATITGSQPSYSFTLPTVAIP